MNPPKISGHEKKLIRRYLIWCYKTTKEEIDRIDRKFTQLMADDCILKQLQLSREKNLFVKHIEEYQEYIANKTKEALAQKFVGNGRKQLQSNYRYLKNRFCAIEKTISLLLGKKEIRKIESLYEKEMTRRILESREHT